MKYYQHKDLRISALCLGGAQFGQQYGIGSTKELEEREIQEIIETAVAGGVNFFDTAAGYGKSEELLGKYLPQDAVVATKIGEGETAENSLEKLHRKRVDILYHHDPDAFFVNPEAFFKQKRFAKHLGISVYEPQEAEKALEYEEIEVFQVPYNVFNKTFEQIISLLKQRGKLVTIRSVFVQGLVFLNPGDLSPYFDPIRQTLQDFYSQIGESREEFFLNAVSEKDFGPLIVGVHSAQQLKENLEVWDLPVEKEILIPTIDKKYIDPRKWPKGNQ